MKIFRIILIILIAIELCSCVTLKNPIITKVGAMEDYKYVYISPTNSLTSSSGVTIGGQYYSSEKTVNPSDIISGILYKRGYIKIPGLSQELKDQTMIVNYGESGRRNTGLGGYTIEVTIQFVSAKSNTPICSCTAEGQGATEADDIRIAITRCLDALQ